MEIGDGVKKSSNKIARGLADNVQKEFKGFADGRKHKSMEQAENLVDFVNDLEGKVAAILEGFNSNHKDLSDFVKNLAKNVDTIMETIAKAHKENADNLEESLEKEVTNRLEDFKTMMGNIQKGNEDIAHYVMGRLNGFSSCHANMSETLKKDLDKYAVGIVNETKKLLKGFSDDKEKMAVNWIALTATMARKSSGKPLPETKKKVHDFTQEKIKMEICQFCLAEITAESVNCKYCGSEIESKQISVKPQPTQSGMNNARHLYGNYDQVSYYQKQ